MPSLSSLSSFPLVAGGKLPQEPRTRALPLDRAQAGCLLLAVAILFFSPLVATGILTQQECAHVWVVSLLSCDLTPLRSVFAPSGQVFMHTDSFLQEEGRTCAHSGRLISCESFGGGLFTG